MGRCYVTSLVGRFYMTSIICMIYALLDIHVVQWFVDTEYFKLVDQQLILISD